MKNNPLFYAIAGFIIGGVAVWLAMPSYIKPNTTSQAGQSDTIDAHFIEQMIPHHEDAITMSNIAIEKAAKPEVKQLAQSIIQAQQKEINDMKGWYTNWFGRDLPTDERVMGQHGMSEIGRMHMGMMGNDSDIAKFESAADFDRAYIEDMIPHHQMAVMMANMLKNSTNRSEMKKLADAIITSQTAEITMMRAWLNDWK